MCMYICVVCSMDDTHTHIYGRCICVMFVLCLCEVWCEYVECVFVC